MKNRIVYSILMMIAIICISFGVTILGALNEQEQYKQMDSESGEALFASDYEEESIADVYTPTEAITMMKQLQKEISGLAYFNYYTNIAIDGVDDISVVGSLIQQELKNYIKEGVMIDSEYHIKDMSNIEIPAMIGEELLEEYHIGDVVEGKINETSIRFKIIGVLKEDSYVQSVDTYFSSFTIPELYFDVEAVTEEEKLFQEWVLNATIGGTVSYNSATEYNEFAEELYGITEKIGLKWKLEERIINRYQNEDIEISEMTAKTMIFIGILFMVVIGIIYSYIFSKLQNYEQVDIVVRTRVVIKEMMNVLGCYILIIISGGIVLKDSIYQYNFLREKGCVLFCLIIYMFIVCTILCNSLKVDCNNGCN